MKKKLIIASYGLEPKHITLETLSALKKCSALFSHSLGAGSETLVSKLCPELRALKKMPQAGIARELKKAFSKHGTVGFLTYGNPFFLNFTAALLAREMSAIGVEVRVLPAVSSFDSIVNMLDLNKFSLKGLRLVDIAACMEDVALTPDMDTLFFMVGDLNLKGNGKFRSVFLKELSSAYPAANPVFLINCPSIENSYGRIIATSIGSLARSFSGVDKATTMFIPSPGKGKI